MSRPKKIIMSEDNTGQIMSMKDGFEIAACISLHVDKGLNVNESVLIVSSNFKEFELKVGCPAL